MGGSAPRPGRFTPGKDPVPIVQEAGWAPGTVWTGAENLAPNGIRSQDRPARSESLYRLSYTGPQKAMCMRRIFICSLSGPTVFVTLLHTLDDFRKKKVIEHKMCFDFLYKFSESFIILIRNKRRTKILVDMYIICYVRF